jgi:hypothetical protein
MAGRGSLAARFSGRHGCWSCSLLIAVESREEEKGRGRHGQELDGHGRRGGAELLARCHREEELPACFVGKKKWLAAVGSVGVGMQEWPSARKEHPYL